MNRIIGVALCLLLLPHCGKKSPTTPNPSLLTDPGPYALSGKYVLQSTTLTADGNLPHLTTALELTKDRFTGSVEAPSEGMSVTFSGAYGWNGSAYVFTYLPQTTKGRILLNGDWRLGIENKISLSIPIVIQGSPYFLMFVQS